MFQEMLLPGCGSKSGCTLTRREIRDVSVVRYVLLCEGWAGVVSYGAGEGVFCLLGF
jgi:hypothetical protein